MVPVRSLFDCQKLRASFVRVGKRRATVARRFEERNQNFDLEKHILKAVKKTD